MGVSSNPKVFLSDKDLKGANIVDPEVALLVHNQACQTLIQEDHHLIKLKQLSLQERLQQEEQGNNIIVTKPPCPITLELEIPSSYVGSENDDDSSNDGYTTPTSSDNKIPVILECPGAPKRTKRKPATKRKACRRRVVLDLSQDLESLFPMPYAVDLGGGGGGCGESKRVKHC